MTWRPTSVPPDAARFARTVVARLGLRDPARAKTLLWSCGKLAAFASCVGYEMRDDIVFSPSTIERFVVSRTDDFAPGTRRTLRTNLRFVAERLQGSGPSPAPLPRGRAKDPYSEVEITRYLASADAQPTEARRNRANSLICLGAGAGLTGIDLRAVRGSDVDAHHGGVVVRVRAGRPRVVPVLARFHPRLLAAASFFGPTFVVGGVEPSRRNVTSPLIASLSGGVDLPRLELGRLRATWLAAVATAIGLPTFMAAAGITCSQHLGDVVAGLSAGTEAEAMALLGWRR